MIPIYLDYNATTPIDKEVASAMKPFLDEYFGNPSSVHSYGETTKKAVIRAREQIASLIGANPDEIIFTSGGTESNNYAIKGAAFANRGKGNHIITSSVEHPAVTEVCRYLEQEGFNITYIPVDEFGLVAVEDVEKAITPQTILISVMHANNEVGTIQPIEEIGKVAKKYQILFHSDAAQSLGKIEVNVEKMGVDLLSIAGHKLYAPKGIGALYIRRGIKLQKLIHGADHEMNLRAGTENVLEIVGLGKAAELAQRDLQKTMQHLKKMRDALNDGLFEKLPDIKLNGHPEKRLPNTLSISFPGVEANTLLAGLKDVAASAGAACHTDSVDVSPVLEAMKLPVQYAMGTIRFSTGRHTTSEEIEKAVNSIVKVVHNLKSPADLKPVTVVDLSDVKLTQYTHGLGCACKIRPQYLERVLKDFPLPVDPNVLISLSSADDAAVYKINEEQAIIQTVDFFTPIVDDPYDFGAIAAANALSDIYAMGGKPLFALNIVGFPDNRLPEEVLKQILKGAQDVAEEAGMHILGGHTVEDTEPKFGMTVTGIIHPDKILANNNLKAGDALVLTKPIGTGIIATALKRGLTDISVANKAKAIMRSLNKTAAEVMTHFPVNACTDVTGFGLLGHLWEMSKGSGMDVEIDPERVPLIAGVEQLAINGIIPGGTVNNKEYVDEAVDWGKFTAVHQQLLLCDAQTSGGLLISIPSSKAQSLLAELKGNGLNEVAVIGRVREKGVGKIYLKAF
ncbi:MAG: selenide, water dikinase SelD [Bacteroidetes bacterium]|nr:selenide, water dikinase SelD [Bacteroidota bacterium]